jgi:hypothetical protein
MKMLSAFYSSWIVAPLLALVVGLNPSRLWQKARPPPKAREMSQACRPDRQLGLSLNRRARR